MTTRQILQLNGDFVTVLPLDSPARILTYAICSLSTFCGVSMEEKRGDVSKVRLNDVKWFSHWRMQKLSMSDLNFSLPILANTAAYFFFSSFLGLCVSFHSWELNP